MENQKLEIDIGLQNAECLMMESPRFTNEQMAFVLRQQFLNLASHLVACRQQPLHGTVHSESLRCKQLWLEELLPCDP